MLQAKKRKHLFLKFFSLFSLIRGYNILIIILAQYLTSIYILAYNKTLTEVVLDINLFMLVCATAGVIASGYIINNFYDAEKDLINRPQKSILERLINQNIKLSLYFILNFLSLIAASYVSFRAVLFFSGYIFGIWIYSHRIKKLLIIGNLTSAILAITPFFAIFIYYKNFDLVIFVHALFLFLIIVMRELTKDLENIKGDLALDYKTIPVVYGASVSKIMLTVLAFLTLFPILLLINCFNIGHMHYYFYASSFLLLLFILLLWWSNIKIHYIILHSILKLIIIIGVFSILLIDINLVLNKIF